MILNHIYPGDCLQTLKTLPDNSIDCCVTSPPYFALRAYLGDEHPDKSSEIGTEETPEAFIQKLVAVFSEVRRVLKKDGSLWVNIGDSFAASGGHTASGKSATVGNTIKGVSNLGSTRIPAGLKQKDLIGIPWMLAFALRADGWYLRSEIIWHKPNPMPESVTDRPTKSHEQIFLLTKSANYYYDNEAIKIPAVSHGGPTWEERKSLGEPNRAGLESAKGIGQKRFLTKDFVNKRSVWTVATRPFTGHVESYHYRRVESGVVSGGMKRIKSLSCPVHGSTAQKHSSVLCDEYEGDSLTHTEYTGAYHDQEQKDDFAPTVQTPGENFEPQSLDCSQPVYVLSAIDHNRQTRKTDPVLLTSQPCISFAQTLSRIDSNIELREISDSVGRKLVSNTLPDELDDLLWVQIQSHNVSSSSLDSDCSCAIYEKITKKTDHFATFPTALIEPCIKAGCPKEGTILDPFMGAGTTALVAASLGRNFVGCELNESYIAITRKRLDSQLGMFNPLTPTRHVP